MKSEEAKGKLVKKIPPTAAPIYNYKNALAEILAGAIIFGLPQLCRIVAFGDAVASPEGTAGQL